MAQSHLEERHLENAIRYRTRRLIRVRQMLGQLEKVIAALDQEWTEVDRARVVRLEGDLKAYIDQMQREDLDVALGRVPAADRAA